MKKNRLQHRLQLIALALCCTILVGSSAFGARIADVRGTLHITSAGQCSWYEFASEIFGLLGLRPDFTAISTAEAKDAAQRPAYSVLDNGRLASLGIEQPREWREALMDYLKLKGRLAA